jgi:hypothetical protein
MSSQWRTFEKDFREIPDPFNDLRADYQENTPDPCGLTGWTVRDARFKAIAVLAGNELWRDKSLRPILPDEVMVEPDPLNRWLTAVRLVTGRFEWGLLAYEQNDDGSRGSRIQKGTIQRVIEASALLCLQLAAHESPHTEIIQTLSPTPRESKRVALVRIVMKSRAYFADHNKVLELAKGLDEAGIRLPVHRTEPHGKWEPKSFMEVAKKPSHPEYRRIFGNRNGALVRDLGKR